MPAKLATGKERSYGCNYNAGRNCFLQDVKHKVIRPSLVCDICKVTIHFAVLEK